jgi:hypothetical protein
VESSVQRTRLFRTACKTKDKVCKVIVDSGSKGNICWVCVIFFARVVVLTYFFQFDIFLSGRHISGMTYFWDNILLG